MRVDGQGGWDTGHRWDPKRVLLDPYAPLVSSRKVFGVRDIAEQYKPEVMLPGRLHNSSCQHWAQHHS